MYHAKENGKARYEMFDTRMHANVVAKLQLENDLRRAVENHEFVVFYQPIVSLRSGKIAGFEALARWNYPARGFVSPAEFIPLAEETGLITEIDTLVLGESCRQMRLWSLVRGNSSLSVSVNLSSKHFAGRDLIGRVERALSETGLESKHLKLEITESAVMDCAETAASLLTQLRELGIQLSIDDFGTGYSSLSYLHRFPVNTLKIDRTFVSRMADGDENSEIVKTIVTLASNLGMSVVAEGVETREQNDLLRGLNCEYGQGYFFSKPVDAAMASDLLLKANGPAYASHPLPFYGAEHSYTGLVENLGA